MDAVINIPYQVPQGLIIFSLFHVGQEFFQFLFGRSILQVSLKKICQFVFHDNNTISSLIKTKQELALPIPMKNKYDMNQKSKRWRERYLRMDPSALKT